MSDRKGERERKEKKIEIFTIRIRHGSGSIDVDDKHETEILSPTIYHWCISPRLSCPFVPLESRHRSGLLACFDTLNYCPGTGAAATCKRSPHMALGLYIGGCVRIASFQLLRKCTAAEKNYCNYPSRGIPVFSSPARFITIELGRDRVD